MIEFECEGHTVNASKSSHLDTMVARFPFKSLFSKNTTQIIKGKEHSFEALAFLK